MPARPTLGRPSGCCARAAASSEQDRIGVPTTRCRHCRGVTTTRAVNQSRVDCKPKAGATPSQLFASPNNPPSFHRLSTWSSGEHQRDESENGELRMSNEESRIKKSGRGPAHQHRTPSAFHNSQFIILNFRACRRPPLFPRRARRPRRGTLLRTTRCARFPRRSPRNHLPSSGSGSR